jgi:hypothetical protein
MVTKRQLGILMMIAAVLLAAAALLVDTLQAGRFQGIGPLQTAALGAALLTFLIGLTLWPLGDRPA